MIRKIQLIAFSIICFGISFIIMLDQYVNWGTWFEIYDIHHELFIVTFLILGISSLVMLGLNKKGWY